MKAVILQPSYIPWRGYFLQILLADVFVFYDDVQYDRRGWRNRNRIKTAAGPQWLTIPVHSKGVQIQNKKIKDIEIAWDKLWNKDHWKSIYSAYKKAPFFDNIAPTLEYYYQKRPLYLADFTIELTIHIAHLLGIQQTQFLRSSELESTGNKTDRLLSILNGIHADHYISGPSAKNYLEENKFDSAGITLEYVEYEFPEYPQLYPPYDESISILDLLFMVGPNALDLILPGS